MLSLSLLAVPEGERPDGLEPGAEEPGRRRRISRGWLAIIIIAAVLLALLVAIQVAAPGIASRLVEAEISERYPEARDVKVEISAFPALKLAFKKYSSLRVTVSGITLQGINFDTIELESSQWPDGTFTAVVSPEEAMRFFSTSHSYVLSPSLSLESGKIRINGEMEIGRLRPDISSIGNLVARDGKSVFFVPETISVTGMPETGEAVNSVRQVMDTNPVFIVRPDLPFDVTSIAPTGGHLEVKGKVDLEKALDIKI